MDTTQAPARSHRALQATFALLAVTVIWGCTFVWMKQGIGAVESKLGSAHVASGVAVFMALRFGLAAACIAVCLPSARRGCTRAAWIGGLWLGLLLFAGFVLQMIGLQHVTPAVSAFLTSLYVLFTALITAALKRRGVGLALAFGVLLATVGAGFIRGRPELAFNLAEMLTVGCAFVFALHILATDRITKRVAPMPVTLTSFAWVTAASLVWFALLQCTRDAPSASAIVALLHSGEFILPLALTSLFATVIALSLMNVYQRELDPVRAAILYALEPIWAAGIGISSGLDRFTPYLWIGGGMLLAGNLIAEAGGQRQLRKTPAS